MDVEKLAREAGFTENMGHITARHSSGAWVAVDDRLDRFADLVRNAVLEEAAATKAPEQLDAGARKLAELLDYPWAHMPEQGRQTMRNNVIAVLQAIDAAAIRSMKEVKT